MLEPITSTLDLSLGTSCKVHQSIPGLHTLTGDHLESQSNLYCMCMDCKGSKKKMLAQETYANSTQTQGLYSQPDDSAN